MKTFQRNSETGVSIEELRSTEWLSSGTRGKGRSGVCVFEEL
jgi:hypothetical protein